MVIQKIFFTLAAMIIIALLAGGIFYHRKDNLLGSMGTLSAADIENKLSTIMEESGCRLVSNAETDLTVFSMHRDLKVQSTGAAKVLTFECKGLTRSFAITEYNKSD